VNRSGNQDNVMKPLIGGLQVMDQRWPNEERTFISRTKTTWTGYTKNWKDKTKHGRCKKLSYRRDSARRSP